MLQPSGPAAAPPPALLHHGAMQLCNLSGRWQSGGNAPSAYFLFLREAGQASVRGPSSEPGCLEQGMQRPFIFQGSLHAASGWRCSSLAGFNCSSNLLMLRNKRKDAGWEAGGGQSGDRGQVRLDIPRPFPMCCPSWHFPTLWTLWPAGLCSQGYFLGRVGTESGRLPALDRNRGPTLSPQPGASGRRQGKGGAPSKCNAEPGLWGDLNTGAAFPVQAQPMPGKGEKQHFSWSRGQATLFPMPVKSHQQKSSTPSTPPRETTSDLDVGIQALGESSFFVCGQAAKSREPETASLSNQSHE